MTTLEDRLKHEARMLGFELVGIATAKPADSFDRFEEWLKRGYAGEMGYLQRHVAARQNPTSILADVKSVVMVGMNYKSQTTQVSNAHLTDAVAQSSVRAASTPCRISCYAQGSDYHDVLRSRLRSLLAWVQEQVKGCRGRVVIDTAPLLERDFARRAGLGWIGKNTMLLNKQLGSYFFLGALLLSIELRADSTHETSHCGSCRACLDACPTDAFVAPGELDARRCISYLTIELRGPIPEQLRAPMGEWVFGCDICQDVCPWNRKAPPGREPALQPRPEPYELDLHELLRLTPERFRARFRGTALTRPKRSGLLRNAAIALGNRGDPAALPSLRAAAADDDAVVREAAEWAIAQIESKSGVPQAATS